LDKVKALFPPSLYSGSIMKKQILQVSVMQSAKVIAVLYFVMSIPFFALMALSAVSEPSSGIRVAGWLAMPLAYAFGGFLGCVISASVYNIIAARIGGFEFTTAEVAPVSH
jgi:hypothetical protein